MEKHLYIQPRQTGKTTKLIEDFLLDPHNSIIVVISNTMRKVLIDKLLSLTDLNNEIKNEKFLFKRIISVDNLLSARYTHGIGTIKHILFDEYFFIKNKVGVYRTIQSLRLEKLSLYSTADKEYKESLIKIVKHFKKYNIPLILDYPELVEYHHNFITDDDIIIHEYKLSEDYETKMNYLVNMLDPIDYKVSIKNDYLIKDIN
jgi:hypothetical protein